MPAANTDSVASGISEDVIERNRSEILSARKKRSEERKAQIEAQQQSDRSMLFFPKKFTSAKERAAAGASVYSKEERMNVIVNGVQIHPDITYEEQAVANALSRFNRRVILIQNAVDMKNVDSLLRVIFNSELENENEFDPQPLVDEAIRYCNLKRYFHWSSDLLQCGTTFQYSDKIRFNFNCRVMKIHNAIDRENVASLVNVIFDSQLQDEKIVNFEPLVAEAIQYCVKTKHRFLLPPVLSRFSAVFQPCLETDDYNQKIQKLADFMGCNSLGFSKILLLFNYLNRNRLDSIEDTIKESWPLNQALLDGACNTQGAIQKQVMHFLIEIIEPVSRVDVDSALQALVDKCTESIHDLLSLSSDKAVNEPYTQLMSFLNSMRSSRHQCTVSAPLSEGSDNDGGLSNDSTVFSPY